MGRSGWVVVGVLLVLGLLAGWAAIRRWAGRRRHDAPAVLGDRARRRSGLRPLTPATRDAFTADWHALQARFADQPDAAVRDADALVGRLMEARGCPGPAEGATTASDQPALVEDLRLAKAMGQRSHRLASTDDLRRALLRYRSLLDELLVVAGPDGRPRAAPLSEQGWGPAPVSMADMPPLGGKHPGPRVS